MDFRRIEKADGNEIISILNYYITNGFHAYPENEFPLEAFNAFYSEIEDFPNVCCVDNGKIIGYAMLRAFRQFSCFDRTAEITYFILPEYTGRKLGEKMLSILIDGAIEKGIKVILANISSLNEGSIRFHEKHGFVKCGHFKNVVEKNGVVFDMIWMQREI